MMHKDPRETSLSWLRGELAKLGIQSYVIPANDAQGPSLHCDWGDNMVTVSMCYGTYIYLKSYGDWANIPGNHPQECASEIARRGETSFLGQGVSHPYASGQDPFKSEL